MARLEEPRRLSERSLAQSPGNANASHNLAHISFETLDNDGGAAFLGDWLATYDPRASFHCHLAWHLAMFELHRGRYARAQEIFERDILNAANPRLAMIDGAALLWRVPRGGALPRAPARGAPAPTRARGPRPPPGCGAARVLVDRYGQLALRGGGVGGGVPPVEGRRGGDRGVARRSFGPPAGG